MKEEKAEDKKYSKKYLVGGVITFIYLTGVVISFFGKDISDLESKIESARYKLKITNTVAAKDNLKNYIIEMSNNVSVEYAKSFIPFKGYVDLYKGNI